MNNKHNFSRICQSCAKCCLNTEMELSFNDIQKIKVNYHKTIKENYFTEFYDGFFHLKNIDGHCVFLDVQTKSCKIYEFRPTGCRFYPLIYDISQDKCVLDDDCPFLKSFQFLNNDLRKCDALRKWVIKELL